MKEQSMQAAVVHEFTSPLRLEEVAKPEPGPGEIVVKIEASGLCHTDIHAAHGDWPVKPKLPFIPGHEGVGIVEMVGPGVIEVKEGDRVAIPWLGYACGSCEYCVSGWETLCEKQLNTGYFLDGAYAEYAKAFARYVGKVPANVKSLDLQGSKGERCPLLGPGCYLWHRWPGAYGLAVCQDCWRDGCGRGPG